MKIPLILVLFFSLNNTYAQIDFQPTLESLHQYQCPERFRDAKFGIYVHWGVYSVAEYGEWYAREMYMEGHDGLLEGMITHKSDKGPKRAPYFEGVATLDIERGKSRQIRDEPWQTDDSIGPWGYNKTADYKDTNAVIDKMIED